MKVSRRIIFGFSFLIIGLGIFVRFAGLKHQGLIFYDEGNMILKFLSFQMTLSDFDSQAGIPADYLDTKPLWMLVIFWAHKIHPVGVWVVQNISALCGALTIGLTFLLARELAQKRSAALLSAVFLAVSSYHVFYCRLLLPESAGLFLSIFAIFCYLRGMRSQKVVWSVLSGIVIGIALLTNRYRILTTPIFILIFEMMNVGADQMKPGIRRGKRLLLFFGMVVLVLISYEGLLLVLKELRWFYFPSFFKTLFEVNLDRKFVGVDGLSWLTFPFYIYKFDGVLILLLLVFGFLFLKENPVIRLLISLILTQIILCSLSYEKGARLLAPVLPFVSMLAADVFVCAWERVRNHSFRSALICLLVFHIVQGLGASWSLSQKGSDFWHAAQFIKTHYPHRSSLATDSPVMQVYAYPDYVADFDFDSLERLQQYAREDFAAAVIGPFKYFRFLDYSSASAHPVNSLIQSIESECIPVKVYSNFKPVLMERALMEGTYYSLRRPLEILRNDKMTAGHLKVYDLKECVNILSSTDP
jgi:hypothetical protein